MSEKLPRFNGGPEFAPQKPEDGLESTEKEAIEKVLSNLTRINKENGHDIDKLNDGHNQRVIAGAYDFYRGLSKKAYQALDVREKGKGCVSFSAEVRKMNVELKRFLFTHLYKHFRVLRMADKAERIMRDLFYAYQKNMQILS